jgi:hypothetical protein
MPARRTAIVPNMIWGTAIPSQLVACRASTVVEPRAAVSGRRSGAGHSGLAASEAGKVEGSEIVPALDAVALARSRAWGQRRRFDAA